MPSENADRLRKKLKEDLFYIMGSCCAICGYNRCIKACEFHHLEKDKKDFSISNFLQKGKELNILFDEARKCVMLCSNCHREVHDGMHTERQLVCTFSHERFEEIFSNRRCLFCGILLYNIKSQFCSKRCRGKNNQSKQQQFSNQERREKGKFIELNLKEIDILELVIRHKGIMAHAAAEVGVSDRVITRRFKKITGYQTYQSYLNALSI